MTHPTRHDPFDLAPDTSFGDFSELFRGVFVHPAVLDELPEIPIRLDLTENAQTYLVEADIPGASKDDIGVDIDRNQVLISVEARAGHESRDGERTLRAERYLGRSTRSFTLAHDVDESQAEARYANGVLTLRLPKKTTGAARTLSVR